jgi:small subunit ribosomal protein S20
MAREEKVEKKVKKPSAQKRDEQHERNRLRNRAFKSSVRTAIRALDESLEQKDAKLAKEKLNEVYSIMDKGVKKGVLKANQANRTKGRLAARSTKTLSA